MLASIAQTVIALLIVAAAVVYIGLVLVRSMCGRGGCSGCHVGPEASADAESPAGHQPRQIVPLEDLANRARRHREGKH